MKKEQSGCLARAACVTNLGNGGNINSAGSHSSTSSGYIGTKKKKKLTAATLSVVATQCLHHTEAP